MTRTFFPHLLQSLLLPTDQTNRQASHRTRHTLCGTGPALYKCGEPNVSFLCALVCVCLCGDHFYCHPPVESTAPLCCLPSGTYSLLPHLSVLSLHLFIASSLHLFILFLIATVVQPSPPSSTANVHYQHHATQEEKPPYPIENGQTQTQTRTS